MSGRHVPCIYRPNRTKSDIMNHPTQQIGHSHQRGLIPRYSSVPFVLQVKYEIHAYLHTFQQLRDQSLPHQTTWLRKPRNDVMISAYVYVCCAHVSQKNEDRNKEENQKKIKLGWPKQTRLNPTQPDPACPFLPQSH